MEGIPGGRDIRQDFVERFYAKNKPGKKYKGCSSYEDFREMFEKEKDIDAMMVTNDDDANKFLYREYRKGWEL